MGSPSASTALARTARAPRRRRAGSAGDGLTGSPPPRTGGYRSSRVPFAWGRPGFYAAHPISTDDRVEVGRKEQRGYRADQNAANDGPGHIMTSLNAGSSLCLPNQL